MSHKYHVTIEDCVDEEEAREMRQRSSVGIDDLDLGNISQGQPRITDDPSSRGSKRQAWDEVEALEEKARSEKLQDQSTAIANASETARIVKEAQQSSDY